MSSFYNNYLNNKDTNFQTDNYYKGFNRVTLPFMEDMDDDITESLSSDAYEFGIDSNAYKTIKDAKNRLLKATTDEEKKKQQAIIEHTRELARAGVDIVYLTEADINAGVTTFTDMSKKKQYKDVSKAVDNALKQITPKYQWRKDCTDWDDNVICLEEWTVEEKQKLISCFNNFYCNYTWTFYICCLCFWCISHVTKQYRTGFQQKL